MTVNFVTVDSMMHATKENPYLMSEITYQLLKEGYPQSLPKFQKVLAEGRIIICKEARL